MQIRLPLARGAWIGKKGGRALLTSHLAEMALVRVLVLCILTVQIMSLRMFVDKIPDWIEDYRSKLKREGIGSEWKAVLPTTIGKCVNTSIIGITDRFGERLSPYLDANGFDSGSAADFRNGGHVISYSKEGSEAECRNSAIQLIAKMHQGMLAPMRFACVPIGSALPKGAPR